MSKITITVIFILFFGCIFFAFFNYGKPTTTIENDSLIVVANHDYKLENKIGLETTFVCLDNFTVFEKNSQGKVKEYYPQYINGSYFVKIKLSSNNFYSTDISDVKIIFLSKNVQFTYFSTNKEKSVVKTIFIIMAILLVVVYYQYIKSSKKKK